MHFKACAEGEHKPGKTYYGRDAGWVGANALGCIIPGVGPTTTLLEVRLEGVTICVGGAVTGKEMTVVRVLTAEERCASWTGTFGSEDGMQLWFRDGHLEEDLPAVVWANGGQAWYQNGQVHREGDLAAVVWLNGDQWWYRDEQLHREEGPAVVDANGDRAWYKNGQLHREGGPAVIYGDGTQEWFRKGVRAK